MLVFVYGTLMRAQANHRVLVELGARRIGEVSTAATRTLVDLGPYPALLAEGAHEFTPAAPVFGEVYELPEEAIEALDVFEGCPDLYRRERVALATADGSLDAWTYVLAARAPAHAVVIPTGRYAGGGIVLKENAREAQALVTLDKIAATEEGSLRIRPGSSVGRAGD